MKRFYNLFGFLKPRRKTHSGVRITETDLSSIKTSENYNFAVFGKTERGPKNEPIVLIPKTKPVKWFQIWRYKDKKKYKEEVKECREKFYEMFGEPNTI